MGACMMLRGPACPVQPLLNRNETSEERGKLGRYEGRTYKGETTAGIPDDVRSKWVLR